MESSSHTRSHTSAFAPAARQTDAQLLRCTAPTRQNRESSPAARRLRALRLLSPHQESAPFVDLRLDPHSSNGAAARHSQTTREELRATAQANHIRFCASPQETKIHTRRAWRRR